MIHKRVRVLAVLREKTRLLHHGSGDVVQYPTGARHLQRVVNKCVLQTTRLLKKNGELETKTYEHSIEGYLDLSKRTSSEAGEVFGWDDVFCVAGTDVSYHELQGMCTGLKLSARDQAIGEWITDTLYYKSKVLLHDLILVLSSGLPLIRDSWRS